MQFHTNDVHEFLAGLGVFHEGAGEIGGGGDGVLLLDTAHGHAHVLGLDDDGDAKGIEGFLYAILDLLSEALLNL